MSFVDSTSSTLSTLRIADTKVIDMDLSHDPSSPSSPSAVPFDPFTYVPFNNPTGLGFHNAAGILQVNIVNNHLWGKFVLQHKFTKETQRWNDTIAIPSGKIAQHPDKLKMAPNTPEYKKALDLHESEVKCPVKTAIRETYEETGDCLINQFHPDNTMVLLNNGYKRWKYSPTSSRPFVCVTYVTFRRNLDMAKDLESCWSSSETTKMLWIRLDTLFPSADDSSSFHQFFESVYTNNQNFELGAKTIIIPKDGFEVLTMASYVARTLNNDLKNIFQFALGSA